MDDLTPLFADHLFISKLVFIYCKKVLKLDRYRRLQFFVIVKSARTLKMADAGSVEEYTGTFWNERVWLPPNVTWSEC